MWVFLGPWPQCYPNAASISGPGQGQGAPHSRPREDMDQGQEQSTGWTRKPEARKATRGMWWVAKSEAAAANIKARDHGQESKIQWDEGEGQVGLWYMGRGRAVPRSRHVRLALMCLQQRGWGGSGASLVAQWLGIRLPMQGTRVRALVRWDPTCRGAAKPVCHNYWACTLEPASHNYWAHAPQLLKPACL